MKKQITRIGKIIIAEVIREVPTMSVGGVYTNEVVMVSKTFRRSILMIALEPTAETYQKANEWADRVIELHHKGTMTKGKNEIKFSPKDLQLSYFVFTKQIAGNKNIDDFYHEVYLELLPKLIEANIMGVQNYENKRDAEISYIRYFLAIPKIPQIYINKLVEDQKMVDDNINPTK